MDCDMNPDDRTNTEAFWDFRHISDLVAISCVVRCNQVIKMSL